MDALQLRCRSQHVAELSHRRRALHSLLRVIDAAAKVDIHFLSRKDVAPIDQECRRAVKAEPICVVWRVDALIRDFHIFAPKIFRRLA